MSRNSLPRGCGRCYSGLATDLLLAVPLLREQQNHGSLDGLAASRRGSFAAEVVNLLQTFATQSASGDPKRPAVPGNRGQEPAVESANRHKSEFLANMSHELRTPAQRDHRLL